MIRNGSPAVASLTWPPLGFLPPWYRDSTTNASRSGATELTPLETVKRDPEKYRLIHR